jgi:integrase
MPKTYKLSARPCKHPRYSWRVIIPKQLLTPGDKSQHYFKTKKEATEFIDGRKEQLASHGTEVFLPASLRWEVAEGLKALPPGHTLKMVFNHYQKHLAQRKGQTVSAACTQLLQIRQKTSEDKTWKNYKQRMGVISNAFGERDVFSVGTAELDLFLTELKCSVQTRKHYKTLLWSIFNFAGASPNPMQASAFKRLTVRRPPPAVYTPAQMQLLLETCAKLCLKGSSASRRKYRAVLRGLVLGCFAHLRPHETLRLEWKFIDLEAGEIRITEEVAKVKSAMRSVKIEDNLKAWLIYRKTKTKGRVLDGLSSEFALRDWRERLIEAVNTELKEKGVKERIAWLYDGLRHSSCSYCLKKFQDRNRLIEEMGHSEAQTMINHYLNAMVKKEDAEAWYQIYPPKS